MFRILFTYTLCLFLFSVSAQSKKRNFKQRELGFFGGASYYLGDINPRAHMKASHPAGGVYFRYMTNYRFAFRFGVNAGQISGSDAASGEPDQLERNLSFTSRIYEGHALAEFNFVEYRISHDRYRFTMFVFAGLAGFHFNPQSDDGEYLRDQRNEGQSESYPKLQISIPFGVGLKWNIGDKCGMGIEWGPRKTYTDYLDDVHGAYPENGQTPDNGNLARTTNAPGNMRGNPSSKDWYFYYGLTFNIKLKDPNRPCHKGF